MPVRRMVALAALGTLVSVPRSARGDDELNKFVEQNRILAQKVKTEVNHAVLEARVIQKADPEQAQSLLQKALKQVQNSTALSATEQTQLTNQLLARIREVGEIQREQKVAQEQAPLKEPPRRTGTNAPGSGPGAVAQKFIENGKAGAEAASRLQEAKSKGFNAAGNSVASSAIPQSDDVTFPRDWAAKTKLREKYAGPQLSEKEVALVKALNSVLSVDFQEKPLKEVIQYLSDRTGQAIIVDPGSLREANTDYGDPISLKLNKVTFRTILRKVLQDVNLTFVIQEGTIQAVTPARAREMMVVRTYPINDLVAPSGFAMSYGPLVARAQMMSNVQTLVNMVQSSVDPTIWKENGGGATITFHEPSMSLIIRAPSDFHYQFAGGGLFGGSR